MPATTFNDKRRSSRKRFRMSLSRVHEDNTGVASADARYMENPYDDWDESMNQRLLIKIEHDHPLTESIEEEPINDFEAEDDEVIKEYMLKSRCVSLPMTPSYEKQASKYGGIEFAVLPSGKFDHVFEAKIKQEIKDILKNHCRSEQIDCNDKSVYTGLPGITLLYHHLTTQAKLSLDTKTSLELASQVNQHVNQYLTAIKLPHTHNSKCPSYLCGDLGVYALCTIAKHQQPLHREMLTRTLSYPGPHTAVSQSAPSNTSILNPDPLSSSSHHATHGAGKSIVGEPQITSTSPESVAMIEKILELVKLQEQQGTPDELLYGRTGGLFALLQIKQLLPRQNIIKNEHIISQIDLILQSGKSMESFGRPLFYSWHGKEYVGAAHGYIGILYMLLEAYKYLNERQLKLIKDAIDFIESIKYPSGNYPSSMGSQTDRLVHWCHGAPGAVHLLVKAYQVYQDEKYLHSALACGDVIWSRGLLKKGFSLCHGISGNAYAFLHLYQLTGDLLHVYRAGKFAQFYLEHRDKISWRADSLASLFEGYAGLAYFLSDLLNPDEAKFPAFQLSTSCRPLQVHHQKLIQLEERKASDDETSLVNSSSASASSSQNQPQVYNSPPNDVFNQHRN